MSAVMDNSVPLSPNGADDSVTTGTPSPMKQNNNALMDALFKNLTRLFAFLVFILLAAILVSWSMAAVNRWPSTACRSSG